MQTTDNIPNTTFLDELDDLDSFLTPAERAAFAEMSMVEIDAYLAAQESFTVMQAYVEHPDTPAVARALIDLSVWVDVSDPSDT